MDHRRDFLKFAGMAAVLGGPFAAASPARLGDVVVDAQHAKLTREAFGDVRVFFEGPTEHLRSMTAGSLLLKPGKEPHPPHQHPEEEFMVVTEGAGEILVGGQTYPVGPGSMMYCGPNRLHGVKNNSSEPLLFYYYKWLV